MENARATYHAMLRDRVAPALRTLGFKGSGRAFVLPSDDYWALLGFQASSFSHRDAVSFTVNLTVAPRVAWAVARKKWSYLGEKPTVGYGYSVFRDDESILWNKRIGKLLPAQLDHSWVCAPGDPRADDLTVLAQGTLPRAHA